MNVREFVHGRDFALFAAAVSQVRPEHALAILTPPTAAKLYAGTFVQRTSPVALTLPRRGMAMFLMKMNAHSSALTILAADLERDLYTVAELENDWATYCTPRSVLAQRLGTQRAELPLALASLDPDTGLCLGDLFPREDT